MKKIIMAAAAAAISLICLNSFAQDNTLTEQEARDGWKLLWDGQTFAGWRGARLTEFPDTGWTIEDGILKVHSNGAPENGGDIVTTRTYGSNIIIKADFKLAEGTNSGIMYLVDPDPESPMATLACEFQILDDLHHPQANNGINGNRRLGAVFDLIPTVDNKPLDYEGWNTAVILVKGNHVEHWLNGVKLLEYERNTQEWNALVAYSVFRERPNFGNREEGTILLQDEGSEVWFKNIKVKEL